MHPALPRHGPAELALITDLKRRGLLEGTLVVWGGEFGRSTAGQDDWQSLEVGRDHHPRCFSLLLAGAGTRPGTVVGATHDFDFNVVEDPVEEREPRTRRSCNGSGSTTRASPTAVRASTCG